MYVRNCIITAVKQQQAWHGVLRTFRGVFPSSDKEKWVQMTLFFQCLSIWFHFLSVSVTKPLNSEEANKQVMERKPSNGAE